MLLAPPRHLTAASLPSHGRKTSCRRGRLPASSATTGGTVHRITAVPKKNCGSHQFDSITDRQQVHLRKGFALRCSVHVQRSSRVRHLAMPQFLSANASPCWASHRLLSLFINSHCQVSAPCWAHTKKAHLQRSGL